MRLHHRQNTQWTFRNRSQSRSRNENYGNDHIRGKVEIEIRGEEKNLGLDLIQE